jgi:hypothetical protein
MKTVISYRKKLNLVGYVKKASGYIQKADLAKIVIAKRDGSFLEANSGSGLSGLLSTTNKSLAVEAGDEILVLPKVEMKSRQFFKELTQIVYKCGKCSSYFAGNTLIKNGKSPKKWISILGVLNTMIKKNREQKKLTTHELPPISSYEDAYEAEYLKSHLSYRFGYAILKHSGSLIGCLKLPFVMLVQYLIFKKNVVKKT